VKQIKETSNQMGTTDFDLSFGPLSRYEMATTTTTTAATSKHVPMIEYPIEKKRPKTGQ
jgi:hypothetical protein